MFFLYFFFTRLNQYRATEGDKYGNLGGSTNESDRRKKVFGRGTGGVGWRVAVQRYYLCWELSLFLGLPSFLLKLQDEMSPVLVLLAELCK